MKKTFHILTAALLLTAGALLTTGCGNDDTAIDNGKDQPAQGRTVMFTATLAPKGDNGGQTRAITPGTDPIDGKEILNVKWKENEEIALRYQTGPHTYATTIATVGKPNADGSAPISAPLTSPMDGGSVTFVYPASLVNETSNDIDANKLLNQHGNLTGANGISTLFDAATGSGTLSFAAGNAVVSSKVTMHNRVCICKFKFDFVNLSSSGSGSMGETPSYTPIIIEDGDHTYTIVSDKPDDSMYASSGSYRGFRSGDDIYVAILPIENKTVTFTATRKGSTDDTYTIVKLNVTLEKGKFYRNLGTITLLKSNVKLSSSTTDLTLNDGDVVTGTGGENTILKIAAGATVTLNCVTNTGITGTTSIPGIECLGDATIILSGENSVKGREYAPGIFVPAGKTLTIQVRGSGTLTATGGSNGAGIGGTQNTSCGNIVIAGGTITATGTGNCAGIGSGEADGANITCGAITISGGTVTATGGRFAAGIGSGETGSNTNKCGAITISGGTVTAAGGEEGAGIGSGHAGDYTNECDAITISGGTVTATGGIWAAGIGSGRAGNKTNTCGDITISGGTIEATGGDYAVGIGSGNANQARNTCGAITISGSAKVKAVGKKNAAGIGTGNGTNADKNCICGAISIAGGTVEATGGDRAAGIGSGSWGKFTSISIGSGINSVTATRSNNYWNVPIGKGNDDQGSGAVKFGTETMHDGSKYYIYPSDWIHWPTDGQTYGGIKVAVSTYGSEGGLTWTLTPKTTP